MESDVKLELNRFEIRYKGSGKRLLYSGEMCLSRAGYSVLQGESGCGKTTLLHGISGVLSGRSGSCTGVERKKVALMFQELRLFPQRTVMEHLSDVGVRDLEERLSLLHFVGLEEEGDALPSSLSGGMGRRLSFARLLGYGKGISADLFLLDEPFTGVDRGRILSLLDYLSQLPVAVLVASHQTVVLDGANSVFSLVAESGERGEEIRIERVKSGKEFEEEEVFEDVEVFEEK